MVGAGHIAFYATVRTYAEFFESHGFGSQTRGVREAFHAGDVEGMIDCVTDEMVQTLTLTGTAGEVRDRLRQFAGMVDLLRLSAPHHFQPGEVTREYQQRIIGELASL